MELAKRPWHPPHAPTQLYPRGPTRCRSVHQEGVEALIRANTLHCPQCGEIPPNVHHAAGWTYAHHRLCACLQQLAERLRWEEHAAERMQLTEQARAERYLGGMRPTDPVWSMRFATFTIQAQPTAYAQTEEWITQVCTGVREAVAQALEASQDAQGRVDLPSYQQAYAQVWRSTQAILPNAVLLGPSGTGKTHLALACYHAAIEVGIRVRYAPALTLLDQLRATWDQQGPDHKEHEHEEDVLQRYLTTDVLILDGIDLVTKEWSRQRWWRVLDERRAHGRPTFATALSQTSLLQALGTEGVRRLCEGSVLIRTTSKPYWTSSQQALPPGKEEW